MITTLTTRNVSNEIPPPATDAAQPLAASVASTTVPPAEAAPAEAVSPLAERFPSDQQCPPLPNSPDRGRST